MQEERIFNEILVVDDDAGVRKSISWQLSRQGYEVHTASNAEEGLEFLRSRRVDLVISDVRMPGMDGIEFLEHIKEEGLADSVIMISAFGSFDSVIEAMKRGAYDYIHKPFKKEELLLTIRKAEERERLKRENQELKRKIVMGSSEIEIVTHNSKMQEILKLVSKLANFNSTVLITGESGTGKELIARMLHENSPRKDKPFVAINCGAIPESLIESELFGYVKGAFTDAWRDKPGLFEAANGGTLFLDEIGSLPLHMQVKLLRVLQEGEVRRVGGNKSIKIDVRIVAAGAQDLRELIKEGKFREDLYYRLNVVSVHLPPLRERKDDIPVLIDHFRRKFNLKLGTKISGITKEALDLLMRYKWPGNVRELENVIERAMIMADGSEITVSDLPPQILGYEPESSRIPLPKDCLSIRKASAILEKQLIMEALKRTKGNRTAAAKLLEISHRALLYKIKEYDIKL